MSLSTHGKIFSWQDNRPLGKIIHGAIRGIDKSGQAELNSYIISRLLARYPVFLDLNEEGQRRERGLEVETLYDYL